MKDVTDKVADLSVQLQNLCSVSATSRPCLHHQQLGRKLQQD